MKHETAEPAVTPAPRPTENFQDRFAAALEKWRAEGCTHPTDAGAALCGARPHRTKITPADAEGNVMMVVDCASGHEGVWTFKVAEAEMKAELRRQAEAAQDAQANGGKALDPLVAKVTISMHLKTQEVKIDPWVPTPGLGIQLAGILLSHFFAQMQKTVEASNRAPLQLPKKGIIHPKTGRLVN